MRYAHSHRLAVGAVAIILVTAVLFVIQLNQSPPPAPLAAPAEGWKRYDASPYFSIDYPADFAVDENYLYTALGRGKNIHGISFTVPASWGEGTNLVASDTKLAIETPVSSKCLATDFADGATEISSLNDNGIAYTVVHTVGAVAGNRYDETIYTTADRAQCLSIRYFIHSNNIDNYPPGTKTAYDRARLIETFDQMRESFRLK